MQTTRTDPAPDGCATGSVTGFVPVAERPAWQQRWGNLPPSEEVRETKLALMNTLMSANWILFRCFIQRTCPRHDRWMSRKMCRPRGGHGTSVHGSKLLELTQEERWFPRQRADRVPAGSGQANMPLRGFLQHLLSAEKKTKKARSMRFDDVVLGEWTDRTHRVPESRPPWRKAST